MGDDVRTMSLAYTLEASSLLMCTDSCASMPCSDQRAGTLRAGSSSERSCTLPVMVRMSTFFVSGARTMMLSSWASFGKLIKFK